MIKCTIVTASNGDQMAMLPLSDYEHLVASAAVHVDFSRSTNANRNRGARGEETLPAEFAKRLINGENTLRVWREYRGMTQRDLAAATGLSGPFLSQIENGARRGRIGAIIKIANALGITVDDLVATDESIGDPGRAVRSSRR